MITRKRETTNGDALSGIEFLGSITVMRLPVKEKDVGANPTLGAKVFIPSYTNSK